jgi:hypothetical protein
MKNRLRNNAFEKQNSKPKLDSVNPKSDKKIKHSTVIMNLNDDDKRKWTVNANWMKQRKWNDVGKKRINNAKWMKKRKWKNEEEPFYKRKKNNVLRDWKPYEKRKKKKKLPRMQTILNLKHQSHHHHHLPLQPM